MQKTSSLLVQKATALNVILLVLLAFVQVALNLNQGNLVATLVSEGNPKPSFGRKICVHEMTHRKIFLPVIICLHFLPSFNGS